MTLRAKKMGPMAATLLRGARHLNGRSPWRGSLPPVVLMSAPGSEEALAAGLSGLPPGMLVILRHYELPGSIRETLARRLKQVCNQLGHRLIVAGDAALAIRVGADGVHLPEWRLYRPSLQALPANFLVTAACHSRRAMVAAEKAGVHAVLVSPVFATKSHPGAKPLGHLGLARLVQSTALPVYALGGINHHTVKRLQPSGAVGIATVSGFGL